MRELAVLEVVGSEPEAQMIRALLDGEGIPSMVQRTNFAGGMADGFPSAVGPREILVHAENLAAAREVLQRQSG